MTDNEGVEKLRPSILNKIKVICTAACALTLFHCQLLNNVVYN